ncbi:glycosyltransferase family 4 protein [uncultured Capnocytophaga sp.]|jgi:glycosyltransferase, family 1|uniref:glycosyltransferase family 4 protein n=1 Tax=uncultured Capnocytophaga sp. TaxID=159273 RepID=UPI0025916147|nr:glycosyltransferase family 4 protein [uncultured Capnocytophaga sp.]
MKKIILLNNIVRDLLIFRKHLIAYLIERDYQVYAMATDFTFETRHQITEMGAIPVDYSFARGGLNPFSDLRNMYKLERIIEDIAPDVVVASFVKPVIYGTIASYRAKVPKVIAMVEGLGYPFTEQPNGQSLKAKLIKAIQILLYKIALPKAHTVVFLNHNDPTDLLVKYRIPVRRKAILGGIGLILDEFPYSEAPTQPISFIFVARLLREKGVFEFLQAAEIVKAKHPEVLFKVVGSLDNENPGALREKELTHYIENQTIVYPGYVQDVNNWIKESSVFVLPSYREGMPRSTQEAMAVGRAVITTDVPGCRETVIDGKNGFLVPVWDVPALVKAMEYFIANPQEINRMGAESYAIAAERFDGDKVNEKLFKMIEN